MTPEKVNALTKEQIDDLLNGSTTLRFAYYLEQEKLTDQVHVDDITISAEPSASETPVLEGIRFDYDELTIEGRLKELEKINAINMNKLNFKANALMQSEKYKLHNLVIDTFEEDSMMTTSTDIYDSIYKPKDKLYKGPGIIETEKEILPYYIENLIICADHENCEFEYSLDNGSTWYEAINNEIIDISEKEGNELVIKVILPNENSKLKSIAYGWA